MSEKTEQEQYPAMPMNPECEAALVQMAVVCGRDLFDATEVLPRFMAVQNLSAKLQKRLAESEIEGVPTEGIDDVQASMLSRIALKQMIDQDLLQIMIVTRTLDNEQCTSTYLAKTGITIAKKDVDLGRPSFELSQKPAVGLGELRDPSVLKQYLKAGAELVQEGRDFAVSRCYTLVYGMLWRVPVSRDLGDALVRLHMVKEYARSDAESAEAPRYVMRWAD